jgi:hypothetical protein
MTMASKISRIAQKMFTTREAINGTKVTKKPIEVEALQVMSPFRVKSLEGDYAQGKQGDFVIKGVEGENYVCDKGIFFKTYDIKEAVKKVAGKLAL